MTVRFCRKDHSFGAKAFKTFAVTAAILLITLPTPAAAEENPSFEDQASSAVKKSDHQSFLTLSVENDMFGGGSDRHYTNGVRLTYFDLGAKPPDFFDLIDRMIPTFSINETTSIHYSIGQNLYTPRDIERADQPPQDRPWAAFLYVSAGLTSITNNHTDEIEASFGIVGPAALGEQTQKFVHKHISDSPTPRGWSHQLKNEPGLILSWQRRWPERYAIDRFGWSFTAEPYLGATVGNIYTYANSGFAFRLSPQAGKWQDMPPRVRPAMPGTGAFVIPENSFSWHFFGGLEGRAMARNIFLDGNSFTDSHSVDKKYFVGDANAGIALTYGRTRLSYTLVYRSEEFKGQEGSDIFGSISLGYRF